MARELRALVAVEIVAFAIVVALPLPDTIPIAMPLVIVAALSRWIRGRPLIAATGSGKTGMIGVAVGLVALVLALVVATPLVEGFGDRMVVWATYPIARGNPTQAAVVAIVVATVAVAMELALRGWIVERVLELAPPLAPEAVAIAIGAIAEAAVTPGDLAARLGAAVFGVGLGWMYVASGRSVVAPIAARVTFALGALVLEALQVIG